MAEERFERDAHWEGISLFNDGHFWHAHEQWEACWLGSDEPVNTFYRGIIQAAAALYHWRKGNLRGLNRSWAKSRAKLLPLAPSFGFLDLTAFIAAMDAFVADPPPADATTFPLLHRQK